VAVWLRRTRHRIKGTNRSRCSCTGQLRWDFCPDHR